MASFLPVNESFSVKKLNGFTLILPSISVGNVGQLACDLLITSLKMEKIGYFQPDYFLPVAGYNAFSTNEEDKYEISINSEVFYKSFPEDGGVVLIQFRAPLMKKFEEKFCEKLLAWVKECEISQVVNLTSCHSYERVDSQLSGSPFRFLLSSAAKELYETFNTTFNWIALEARNTDEEEDEKDPVFLPGGGFSKNLFTASKDSNKKVIVFSVFCSEGDNKTEAIWMVDEINQWLEVKQKSKIAGWSYPSSWVSFYGTPPPEGIF